MAHLSAAGWLLERRHAGPHAAIPGDLLRDSRLGTYARLLYGVLQLTPGFRVRAGQFTYPQLSHITGVSRNTLRQASRELQTLGWLETKQRNKYSPIHFTLRDPKADRGLVEKHEAEQRLNMAQFRGEALMREYLTLLIDCDEYEDNATPGFLVNPYTGEPMQYDRYYPPRVAFEFNGAQHDGPTEKFPDPEAAWRQRGRDYIKLGISMTRGITLVVLRWEDLTLQTMKQKVQGLLPLRDLTAHGPLVNFLERVSRSYRRKAAKAQAKAMAKAQSQPVAQSQPGST